MSQLPPQGNRIIIVIDSTWIVGTMEIEGGVPQYFYKSTVEKAYHSQEFLKIRGSRPSELFDAIRISDDLSITYVVLLYPSERLKKIWELNSRIREEADNDSELEEPPDNVPPENPSPIPPE